MPTTHEIHADGTAEVVMDHPPVNALTVAGCSTKGGDAANAWNLAAYANAPKREPAKVPDAAIEANRKANERRLALLERTAA